jgi:poly [ADP-ribose] polymerase
MLVLADARENNNKFWGAKLSDSGDVECSWGRVGSKGQSKTFAGAGQAFFDSRANEKRRGGYHEVALVNSPRSQAVAVTSSAVKAQIASANPHVNSLLERLAVANRHEIFVLSGGQIDVSLDGVVSTPVGVIDAAAIASARAVLSKLSGYHDSRNFNAPAFITELEHYLTLVPQKVSARRGWHTTFLLEDQAIAKQSAFLDQLEVSIQAATAASSVQCTPVPKTFEVQLELIEDKRTLVAIEKMFKATLHSQHVSSHLRPIRAFNVSIASMAGAFEDVGRRIGGIQKLWHGTRTYNLLSILKHGLIIPRSGGSYQLTGRMFGDGLYFSSESSKSLNYSCGYWDKTSKLETNCFMFLADVAMGRPFVSGYRGTSGYPVSGYDSVWAKPGQSGVRNHEMIVYDTKQANLTTLVEFSN